MYNGEVHVSVYKEDDISPLNFGEVDVSVREQD